MSFVPGHMDMSMCPSTCPMSYVPRTQGHVPQGHIRAEYCVAAVPSMSHVPVYVPVYVPGTDVAAHSALAPGACAEFWALGAGHWLPAVPSVRGSGPLLSRLDGPRVSVHCVCVWMQGSGHSGRCGVEWRGVARGCNVSFATVMGEQRGHGQGRG